MSSNFYWNPYFVNNLLTVFLIYLLRKLTSEEGSSFVVAQREKSAYTSTSLVSATVHNGNAALTAVHLK